MKKVFKKKSFAILVLVIAVAICVTVLYGCNDNKSGNNVKVTFVYGNGEADRTVEIAKGSTISKPDDPQRDGYEFLYWAVGEDETAYLFAESVNEDITLKALWKPERGDNSTGQVSVTYVYDNGMADYVAKIKKGDSATEPKDPQKDGHIFLYWAVKGEDKSYDFEKAVDGDLVLEAKWKKETTATSVAVRWEENDAVRFEFDGEKPETVAVDSVVKFKLAISPFYLGTPSVSYGGKKVDKGEDGYYSFVAEMSATVRVSGLTRDSSAITGKGTSKDPYLICNESQYKTFVDSINGGAQTYIDAHISLKADLDINGFALDPIVGTAKSQFKGVFDGCGHTVKNFNLSSSEGVVGLFGYIATGTVQNLNVESDVTVIAEMPRNYIIGPVVAYCISGDILNCTYSGNITVKSSLDLEEYVVYVGGICGFVQGYETDATGAVTYCAANADILSDGLEPVFTMGGIAGAAYGSSEGTPAYIYNCSFNGEVGGKSKMSGGIVGYLRERSAVANSYSCGKVTAINAYGYAAAGAIVGVAANESAISYCCSTATLSAKGENGDYDIGDIAGITFEDAYNTIDTRKAVVVDSFYAPDGRISIGSTDYDLTLLDDVLKLSGWRDEWETKGGKILPAYDKVTDCNISITFDFGKAITRPGVDGKDLTQSKDDVVADGYLPIYWIYDGNGMNTFVADDGTVSYGFFFDKELTKRVPSSFIITKDVDIYVGFADYAPVAGEYYLVLDGKEVSLTFDDNGKMTMISGAMVANYMYVYDGEKVLIKDGYFAYLDSYWKQLVSHGYDITTDYYADINGESVLIYDSVFFEKGNASYPPLTATVRNSAMGDWYDNDMNVYRFLSDGTGTVTYANGSKPATFTYRTVGSTVTITMGNTVKKCSITDDSISDSQAFYLMKSDGFKGVWESSFNTKTEVTFDGVGNVIYKGQNFAYTLNEGVASFGSFTARFNENGLLVISDGDKETVFGREGSYMGAWGETYYNYSFKLYGIGKDGYGMGEDSNGVKFTYAPDEESGEISLYYRTMLYGMFDYRKGEIKDEHGVVTGETEMLYLAVYNSNSSALLDDYNMCYYDPMTGIWNSADGRTYDFNGFGAYDINHSGAYGKWVVEGYVTVRDGEETQEVKYTYDKITATAKFTYKNVDYTAALADGDLIINGATFKKPDELSDYKYQSENMILEFNGKSGVGAGVAKLTVGNKTEEYDYTVEEKEDSVVATLSKGGQKIYTVTLTKSGMTICGADIDEELGLYHILAGKDFILSNGNHIGVDGVLDITGAGKGYLGDNEFFVYYVDENYISLYYYDVFLYYLVYYDDNTILLVDDSFETVAFAVVSDGLEGLYEADDGSTLSLDGMSKAGELGYAEAYITYVGDEEEHYYVYGEEDGVYYLYELYVGPNNKDELVKTYIISFENGEGKKEYVSEEGKKIYLEEYNG